MKFRERRPGRGAPKRGGQTGSKGGEISGVGPLVRSAPDIDWEPGDTSSGTSAGVSWGRLAAWVLVAVGVIGVGANYTGRRLFPREVPVEDQCLARRMVLARGALCLFPPAGSEGPDMPEYLAYQDRIVGATMEPVQSVPIDDVTVFLTRAMLSEDDAATSYHSITRGLPAVALQEDPLQAGPETFVCPSGGKYSIQLYRVAGDPDMKENPAPLYPGVTCSVHSGVTGGGKKESRDLLDRSTVTEESRERLGDILDWAGLIGIACVSAGLVLLIFKLVRYRRS